MGVISIVEMEKNDALTLDDDAELPLESDILTHREPRSSLIKRLTIMKHNVLVACRVTNAQHWHNLMAIQPIRTLAHSALPGLQIQPKAGSLHYRTDGLFGTT